MKWFIKCIKNYANFTGRARRAEYWYFVLFMSLFGIVARVLDVILFADKPIGLALSPISTLFSLFFLIPNLAVSVRRLHDIGRSGKWVLLYYVLIIVWLVALMVTGASALAGAVATGMLSSLSAGFFATLFGGGLVIVVFAIMLLIWCCLPGIVGANKYGPDPMVDTER